MPIGFVTMIIWSASEWSPITCDLASHDGDGDGDASGGDEGDDDDGDDDASGGDEGDGDD